MLPTASIILFMLLLSWVILENTTNEKNMHCTPLNFIWTLLWWSHRRWGHLPPIPIGLWSNNAPTKVLDWVLFFKIKTTMKKPWQVKNCFTFVIISRRHQIISQQFTQGTLIKKTPPSIITFNFCGTSVLFRSVVGCCLQTIPCIITPILWTTVHQNFW